MKSNGNSKKALAWISSVAGILIAGAILIFVNAILKPAALRWDCTAEKRYTLSQGSENILKHLDKVVSIRFYYSRNASDMPVVLKNYATRVEDLLGEFQRAGGDKIKLSKLNPTPDSDEEDSAVLDGVSGQSLDMFGSGDPVYFGVAVSCGGKTAVLPFLSPALLGCLFGIVAGIMVFISLDELLPAAEEYGEHHLSIYGVVTGMAVMAVSLILF